MSLTVNHPYNVDIARPVALGPLGFEIVSGDAEAHQIVVTLKNDGADMDVSGASANVYVMRPDGATVPNPATINAGTVSAKLKAESFAVPGRIYALMRIVQGDDILTVLYRYTTVRAGETDVIVDPGEAIPSIDELLAQISAMATVTAAATEAVANVEAALDANADPLPAVRYDEAQGLNGTQKTQARENIGAGEMLTAGTDYEPPIEITVNEDAAPALGTVADRNEYRCTNASITTAPTLTVPVISAETDRFGFTIVYKAPDATAPVITNNSGYTLKYNGDAVADGTFTPVSGTVYRMDFIFDGINLNCIVIGIPGVSGGMQLELAWTNPNPESSFAAQTVSVDLSDADMVGIVYLYAAGGGALPMDIYTKGSSRLKFACTNTNFFRYATTISDTGVVFADGYTVSTYGSNATVSNTSLVPYAIYKIKNAL